MKTKQTVVRTTPKERHYSYDSGTYSRLKDLLDTGYTVVMVNRIGDELEYILKEGIDHDGQ